MRILNRFQKYALEQRYTNYANGEITKLRYKLMFVATAWSVTLLFFHGAQQLLSNGSVKVVVKVDNNIADLNMLPYLVSGLVTLTVVATLLVVRAYQKLVRTFEEIEQGGFPPVEDKPPFSIFGTLMIFMCVVALMMYVSFLLQLMRFNWHWNSFVLPSLIIAVGAVLIGFNAGVSAYTLLRHHKRMTA